MMKIITGGNDATEKLCHLFDEKTSKYNYQAIDVSLIALALYHRDTTVTSFRLLSVCPVDPFPRMVPLIKV